MLRARRAVPHGEEFWMTEVDPATLAVTRRSVHGLAEHVLAAAERGATGSIRLAVRDGALSTLDLPGDPARLELVADGVLVRRPDGARIPLTGSFAAVARAAGVRFGLPDPPYPPASGVDAEDPVELDPVALAEILGAWVVGDAALRVFAPDRTPVVWPEHLDVAITLDEVNYGVSPGDEHIDEPYAYVGPHRPRQGEFWNASFGAARPLSGLVAIEAGGDDAVGAVRAFFDHGRRLAAQ
jgi:hypothetical protein